MSHQQRVAVRRRLGREIADGAAGTATIVDNDLVAPALRELLRHQTADEIVATTRCERENETNRLGRIDRIGGGYGGSRHGAAVALGGRRYGRKEN